ncbi:methionine synthase [Dendrosporobacter sp. 1207_IL3150]|uniref:methionine synthase n=1 Tax=Dendrosporobacter sp. 1207_IL3150 TaxID=3084054 RepID=UPI002FDB0524
MMPLFNAQLLSIDINETRRYAGLSKAKDFSLKLLEDACLEAQLLGQAKGTWQLYDYDNITGTVLSDKPLALNGEKIKAYLKEASKLAVLAVTIGEELEKAITEHFSKGNYSYALLLDAAGTTAVEMAADQISKAIGQQANSIGYTTLTRFSPGYGDWDITAQPDVLALAKGIEAGINVTTSCMLIPRKSVTAVIGFVAGNKDINLITKEKCSYCNQLNCVSRKGEINVSDI